MARVLYRDLLKKLYLKNISYITCTGHERNCYHVALRQDGDGNHFISRNHICFRPNIILHFAFPLSARFFKNSCAGSLVKASRRKAAASSSGMAISSGTRLSMKPPRLQSLWFLAFGFSSCLPQSLRSIPRGFSLLVLSWLVAPFCLSA